MKKFLLKKSREDGFTLIELLVVVIIIAILAAVAVPVYIGIQNNAKKSAIQSDVATTKLNVAAVLTEDGNLPAGTYVSDNTGSSVSAAGDARIQNSHSPADEKVTVTVTAGPAFTVSGNSTTLDYSVSASSATGSTEVGAGAGTGGGGGTPADPYAAGATGIQPGWYNQNNALKWPDANINQVFTYTLTANSATLTAKAAPGTGAINFVPVLWCKNTDGSFSSTASTASQVLLSNTAPTVITFTCPTPTATPYSWFGGQDNGQNQDGAAYVAGTLERPAVYFVNTAPYYTAAK